MKAMELINLLKILTHDIKSAASPSVIAYFIFVYQEQIESFNQWSAICSEKKFEKEQDQVMFASLQASLPKDQKLVEFYSELTAVINTLKQYSPNIPKPEVIDLVDSLRGIVRYVGEQAEQYAHQQMLNEARLKVSIQAASAKRTQAHAERLKQHHGNERRRSHRRYGGKGTGTIG